MKTTVYIDVLISVNTIINFFLIKSVALLVGVPENKKRIIISSIIGSLFSLLVFSDINGALAVLIKLVSLLLYVLISFGYDGIKIFAKLAIATVFINASFTGIVMLISKKSNVFYVNNCFYYIGISPLVFVTSVLLVYFAITLLEFVFLKNNDSVYEIELSFKNKVVFTKAFYDTGFKVKDILTRRFVMLTNRKFIGENIGEINIDISSSDVIPIFYSDISNEGVLPCIKLEYIKIGETKIPNVLLAICDMEIFDDAQIIFGKDIYRIIGE